MQRGLLLYQCSSCLELIQIGASELQWVNEGWMAKMVDEEGSSVNTRPVFWIRCNKASASLKKLYGTV